MNDYDWKNNSKGWQSAQLGDSSRDCKFKNWILFVFGKEVGKEFQNSTADEMMTNWGLLRWGGNNLNASRRSGLRKRSAWVGYLPGGIHQPNFQSWHLEIVIRCKNTYTGHMLWSVCVSQNTSSSRSWPTPGHDSG